MTQYRLLTLLRVKHYQIFYYAYYGFVIVVVLKLEWKFIRTRILFLLLTDVSQGPGIVPVI